MTDRQEPPPELRAALAFGQPLRDGIELVREQGGGTIVVLGYDAREAPLLDGGDVVDQPVTDEAIQRAQGDGATILNNDLDRIIRKHTRLTPKPTTPVTALGTRHAAAERYAAQTGRPVVTVSEERRTVTLFARDKWYILHTKAELRMAVEDLRGHLRALGEQRKADGWVALDQVRSTLLLLDGHLVELGASGDAVRRECATLAATLGVTWPHAVPGHLSRPGTAATVTHNEFSGNAQNVIQAGHVGAVHLATRPVELPVPQQLPLPIPHFTDRDQDVTRVVELLSGDDAEPKVCVIVGLPGVGKSAFAVRCGHAVRQWFPDGILHVDLRGFHPTAESAAPVEVLAGFLRDLGMPETAIPGDLDRMTRLYRSRLHGRRILIILDNAHNPGQVRPLLPGATTCGVLVTSRNAMTGLARDGAYQLTLGPLPPDDAIDLLVRIAGGGAKRTLLQELAGLCAYHPLALCVAGFRPPQELADFVEDLRARPLDPFDDPGDPTGSIKALFALSYQALLPGVQRTFRLLGLYPGATIPAAAAEVLIQGEAGIRELVDAHLLDRAGERRYRFHDLLRAYATECANESEPAEERSAALHRVLDWLRRTAETHDHILDPWCPRISPPDHDRADSVDRASAMAWFDAEVSDLAAATQAALAGGHHELAWRLALAPSAYFYSRKPWTTWISTQEAGLTAARAIGEREAEAWLSDGLGVAYREQGRHDDALGHFEVAVARFVEVGNTVGVAEANLHLAQTYRELGELERARQLADMARSLFRDAGATHGEAKAANLLGGVCVALHDPVTALGHTEQAVAIFAQLGDQYSHSWAVNNLGLVLAKLGRRSEAIAAFRTAMAVRERIDRYGLAFTLHGLGDVLRDNGDLVEARRHWQAALAIFDEIGDLRAGQLRARLDMATDDGAATTSIAAGTPPPLA